jgi:hypothetical protein
VPEFLELVERQFFAGCKRLARLQQLRAAVHDHFIGVHDQRQHQAVKNRLLLRYRQVLSDDTPGRVDARDHQVRHGQLFIAVHFTPPVFLLEPLDQPVHADDDDGLGNLARPGCGR